MSSQWLPIAELAEAVKAGKVSAVDLVNRALKTIEEKEEYRSIIATTHERARLRASEIDGKVRSGKEAGKLAGVPFIAKDNFLVFGAETTAASNILKGFNAPYQSTAIEKLEAEGAICVAKANLDAFGHGASTENSDFYVTKNPHDTTKVPGGSSGGSAAAVVLDMAPFALGTDTGGSSRQPASFSGCVGYKPTYGLISRSGIVAMSSSSDTVGTLAKSVKDAAYVVNIMAGKDEMDSTTIDRQDDYNPTLAALSGKKIGVIKEYMGEGVDEGVRKVVTEAVNKLKAAGAEIEEISLPSIDKALAVYYILVPAEISSNLSRYDGQRYGYSEKEAKDLEESYKKSRGHGFGKEAKRRIMIGTYVLSSGYYDAYYKKAQTVRTKIINEFNDAFKSADFLVGPVAPTTAFNIGENASDPLKMYLCDVMTVAANIVGVPSISIPAGESDKMPVGLQVMAPQKSDKELLSLSNEIEKVLA
ncbi:MAG: Asp-tRNA(Asn)/Glu-tRNA(Gln) amidotransferase subunit GatA [Candidatus Saccharimonadales bacterium]